MSTRFVNFFIVFIHVMCYSNNVIKIIVRGAIMKFADVLKELRTSVGYTQDELSKNMNISKSAISMYENGNREPDFETLEVFADYFNVDIDFLLGRSKIMRKTDLYKSYVKGTQDAVQEKEEDWTEEELVKIEEYKQLLRAARSSRNN